MRYLFWVCEVLPLLQAMSTCYLWCCVGWLGVFALCCVCVLAVVAMLVMVYCCGYQQSGSRFGIGLHDLAEVLGHEQGTPRGVSHHEEIPADAVCSPAAYRP